MSRRRWFKRGGKVVFAVLAVAFAGVAATSACAVTGKSPIGARLVRVQKSPNYRDGVFVNKIPAKQPPFAKALALFLSADAEVEPTVPVPVIARKTADYATPPATGLRVTWMGHSSLLIEIDGRRVLTDPVWGERASPFSFMGPSRFHAPPIALEDLPELDAVVISHDHYDHLDYPTIVALIEHDVPFHVPLAVGAHLEYWGVPPHRIIEYDWWDTAKVGGLELIATPARHASGREVLLTDKDETLWASWAIIGPQHRVFFSGDTSMHPDFEVIGEKYGPFDLTMLECGAYNQLWSDYHMGPEQAVWAHQLLRGKVMMPVHWGTFNLALHSWTEPMERLVVAAKAAAIPIAAPRPGDWFEPQRLRPVRRWWPQVRFQTAKEAPVVSTGLEAFRAKHGR